MNDNKLIAEFMVSVDDYWSKDDNQGNGEQLYFHPHDTEHQQMKPSDMLFQTDWNWLMPVVIKIMRDEASVNDEYREYLCHVLPYGRKEIIYNAAVEFIKEQKL